MNWAGVLPERSPERLAVSGVNALFDRAGGRLCVAAGWRVEVKTDGRLVVVVLRRVGVFAVLRRAVEVRSVDRFGVMNLEFEELRGCDLRWVIGAGRFRESEVEADERGAVKTLGRRVVDDEYRLGVDEPRLELDGVVLLERIEELVGWRISMVRAGEANVGREIVGVREKVGVADDRLGVDRLNVGRLSVDRLDVDGWTV